MTTKSDFPRLTAAINYGISIGLHIGAVVHVRQGWQVLADFAIGAAEILPFTPLQSEQKLLWLSAGKPLTALAIGILVDRGRLNFDTPVCEIIPEFGRQGKERITLRNLLTHTHGYRPPALDWPRVDRDAVIEKICDARPLDGVAPGEYAAYDPQSGWYLLSEIVWRVTGLPNNEFVHREVLEPAGLRSASIGLTAEGWVTKRDNRQLAVLHDTTGSARAKVDLSVLADGDMVITDKSDHDHYPRPWVGDDAMRAAARNPGGGALGAAKDLSGLYELLLNGGVTPRGTRILREETVTLMTSRQRVGMKDNSFGQVIDWGLGFLVNSAYYGNPALPYSYGAHASHDTFGHGGMQSSAGFGDGEHGLAVGIIFNGLPGEPKHQKRIMDVATALYEDLGFAGRK